MKQLVIKLDFEQCDNVILDNFVLHLSKIIQQVYPEFKFPEESWEIIDKE